MGYRVHLCSFSNGTFDVRSPSGKHGLLFEDSDQFGPSKVHPRTGDLSEISERLRWFWNAYPAWQKAGRPTIGMPLTSPIGDIAKADFAIAIEASGQDRNGLDGEATKARAVGIAQGMSHD